MMLTSAWRWGQNQSPPPVSRQLPTLNWKTDPRPQHCPSDADVEATLAELHRLQREERRKQPRLAQCIVALEVLWGTGARPQELAISPVSAFDLRSGVWTVPGGMGSKTGRRQVPLSAGIQTLIRTFLSGRTDGLLFPPRVGHLGNRWNEYAAKGADRAGVPRWTCKGLRHLAITNMLAAGVEVQTVAAVVGNSAETIWKTYAHVLSGRREQSVTYIGRSRANSSSEVQAAQRPTPSLPFAPTKGTKSQ